MSDLVEFLKARLAEDERRALAVDDNSAPWTGQWVVRGEALKAYNGWTLIYKKAGDDTLFRPGLLAHIARHDPARVMREVEAKRAIVDEHPITTGWDGDGSNRPICLTCSTADQSGGIEGDPYPCRTLRLLASPYADHDGYRAEWGV